MVFPFCKPYTSDNCANSDYANFYANCQKMKLHWLKTSRNRLQVQLAAINAAIGELESQIPADSEPSTESAA
ncbi:hypothetical protein Lepto7375DRAFT_6338 [Leptolyngbya sp. PCC 7375]|nr:hypothetical protein Lepto7375DRAFT_6338 [Leptolyngbya sp. PCC 7375]